MLLCRGLTAPEIASKLFISVRTVQTHMDLLFTNGERSRLFELLEAGVQVAQVGADDRERGTVHLREN
jgi:predicted ArsR family transcriptional regulator